MNKEYKIPEGLAIFMDKKLAAELLMDKSIKSPWGFRRAKRCAREIQYFQRKFWEGVYELYPELKGKINMIYKTHEKIVVMGE